MKLSLSVPPSSRRHPPALRHVLHESTLTGSESAAGQTPRGAAEREHKEVVIHTHSHSLGRLSQPYVSAYKYMK